MGKKKCFHFEIYGMSYLSISVRCLQEKKTYLNTKILTKKMIMIITERDYGTEIRLGSVPKTGKVLLMFAENREDKTI